MLLWQHRQVLMHGTVQEWSDSCTDHHCDAEDHIATDDMFSHTDWILGPHDSNLARSDNK